MTTVEWQQAKEGASVTMPKVLALNHWAGRKALVHPLGEDIPRHNLEAGIARLKVVCQDCTLRELSIFIDESGDFGPVEAHSPYYVINLVFHDQSDDITGHLDKIHEALIVRGLPASHGIHTGPLIRREQDYRWLDVRERRSIFRVLVDFVRTANISHHSWVFTKKDVGDTVALVSVMSRELGSFIRDNYGYFQSWDRIVIYYDNGQKELTNIVNSVFNAHLGNVEVRKVVPSEYSLFQAADLCCTLTLVRKKTETGGLSASEQDFFSTQRDSAERSLKLGYFKTMDRKRFGS